MMKNFLLLASLFVLSGCACCSNKSEDANETKQELVGAYGDATKISADDRAMFDKAIKDIKDYTEITPLSVSTQVVAGTNYKFSCTAKDKEGREVKGDITIFKPLPNTDEEPSVTKIQF